MLLIGMIVFGLTHISPAAGQEVGQDITLAGCLVQADGEGDGVEFFLENVTGAEVAAEEIELVPGEGINLAAHVGHTVEVSGVVIADDDEVEGEDEVEEEDADQNELHIRVDRLGHQATSCGDAF
jgi:hypothetical protein